MARTDDDTWDINESVGATALGVAGGRAAETNSANPLIRDPYAHLFLEAAGDGIWRIYLDNALPAELVELDPQFEDRMQAMLGYTACRTKFFDEYFLAAAGDGIRQAVILAAGLDSRAWRLAWPDGCAVYEIDQPKVLAFKTGTLESHGVTPIASHVGIGIDLRLDWPAALVEAGFDPAIPTAWSAEGVLPYLTEAFTNEFFSPDSFARREEQMDRYREAAVKLGGKDVTESGNLLYEGERIEVADWLRAHAWIVTAAPSAHELMAANNRAVPAGLDAAVPESVFVEGRLH
jgi:methyltransferase (TIGR00027 family)